MPDNRFRFLLEYRRMLETGVGAAVPLTTLILPNERPILSKYRNLPAYARLRRFEGGVHIEQTWLPDQLAVRLRPCVATVWDLANAVRPDLYPASLAERWDARFMLKGLRRVDAIVTISDFQRGELSRAARFPADRIFVAHDGIDHDLFTPGSAKEREAARAAVRETHGLEDGEAAILALSGWQPRKNVPGILRTVRALLDRGRRVRLLTRRYGGHAAWLAPIEAAIRDLRLEPHIAWLPEMDDAAVVRYLRGCDLLLFPTYYEGFGLPPVEAMACGCPVVASDVATMPEVVGDAGLLADPDDPEALADAVQRILDDDAFREDLVRRGLARAKRFTWEAAVAPHLAAYEAAARR